MPLSQKNKPKDILTYDTFMGDLSEEIQYLMNELDLLKEVAKKKGVPIEDLTSYQTIKKKLAKLGYMV